MRFNRSAVETRCFRALCAAALAAAFGFAAPAAAEPVFLDDGELQAAPGVLTSAGASTWFDNAGTNPRFTSATFSTTAYYNRAELDRNGRIWVEAKTADQLNALATPPTANFAVTIDVEMTNDEGETASGTISCRTQYARTAPAAPPDPTFTQTGNIDAAPGQRVIVSVTDAFDNAGTNPRFTSITGSSDYVAERGFHPDKNADESGSISVTVKTAAELNAMDSPPASLFTVQFDVEMTNDAGQTASGTLTFSVTYTQTDSGTTTQGGGGTEGG